jgi:hypothetical protein
LGLLFPIIPYYSQLNGKIKNVRNHQPDIANWKIHDKYGVSVAGKRMEKVSVNGPWFPSFSIANYVSHNQRLFPCFPMFSPGF